MTASDLAQFCGVKIKILPDFLMDHTLLKPQFDERLPEHHARWIQFVRRLWAWRGKATFCLRFDGRPDEGAIGLYFLAKPSAPEARPALQQDIEFALGAYGIVSDPHDHKRCLRLLTPPEIDTLAQSAEGRAAWRKEIEDEFSQALEPDLSQAAFISITQDVTRDLWNNLNEMRTISQDTRFGGPLPAAKPPIAAWIPLSWEGPAGPFLLPFKALMAARSRIQLSIFLQPCTVEEAERLWLEKIADIARRDTASQKLSADLASRRCASMARRLLGEAFLVTVQCAALDGDQKSALSVANSIQALCRETSAQPESGVQDSIPGTRIQPADAASLEAAIQSHRALDFPRWADDRELPVFLKRLSYLTDAAGAATAFRFPVSVRAGIPGVEIEQPSPDFNPGPRGDQRVLPTRAPVYRIPTPKPRVQIGRFENAGMAEVDLDDLTKHTLITGFTGSGKTNTVLHLLEQLWEDHQIPFLVIESAKSEYRGLLGVPAFQNRRLPNGKAAIQLLIYTPGNESLAPLRLNPFDVLPGVRAESHISRLQTCFEAALPPFAPLVSILEESLIEVYRDLGWMTTDEGVPRAQLGTRRYPRMSDFASKLREVGESRGYAGDNRATLLAAISGRILPLTRAMHGSKGRMLDTEKSAPDPARLFGMPVILELNDLNEQDKALVTMFIVTFLREYREQQQRHAPGQSTSLRHITVVEEAHNVLENLRSTGSQEGSGSDVRYKAMQAFCAMLSEIRALGEGLIIADQSPEKLAPDAMRNTNLQIAHQLRAASDREAIANAMIMTDEQRDYLGKLRPGQAGIFFTGLQKASFVRVPEFNNREDPFSGRGAGFQSAMPDAKVEAHMQPLIATVREPDRPFELCRKCGRFQTCDYRWKVRELIADPSSAARFVAVFAADSSYKTILERFGAMAPLFREVLAPLTPAHPLDAAWCYFLHMRYTYLKKYAVGGEFDRESRALFDMALVPALKSGSEGDG
jgi:hypothetical protein